jgi:predicted ABC-type ATPase
VATRLTKRDAQGWLIEYDGVPVERVSSLPENTSRVIDHKVNGRRVHHEVQDLKMCINIKGTNGSGKSTIPIYLIKHDTEVVYLVSRREDRKPVATYCKGYDTVILGAYLAGTNCGGCDYLDDTQQAKFVLSRLWKKDVHIIYEGVIVGDIKSTFYELMLAFNQVHERDLGFCFMGTRFRECLTRIQRRNGGKPIKEDLVKSKYKNATTHLRYYLQEGKIPCTVLDTKCSKQEVFERFLAQYPSFNPVF